MKAIKLLTARNMNFSLSPRPSPRPMNPCQGRHDASILHNAAVHLQNLFRRRKYGKSWKRKPKNAQVVAASVVHGMYQRKESKKPKPLVIQATIHIHCVSEFDEPNGTFNAEFSLYLDWQMRDTLSYKWEPDIVFINSLQQVSKISEVEKFEVDKVHRRFRQIKRLKGTFVSTELAFQDFPCDYQQLIIKLKCNDYVCEGTKLSVELVDERSLTHDADGHRFPLHDVGTGRPSRPRTPLESMNNIGHYIDDGADCLFEWDIGKCVKRAWDEENEGRRTRTKEVEDPQHGRMSFSILVYRHPFYQVGNRMVPVFMMVLLCFTSYSLDEKYDKLEVDLMLLLTITQFKMDAASSQAKIPIFTLLDSYMLRSFVFIVFICFEQVTDHGPWGIFLPISYLVLYHACTAYACVLARDKTRKKRDLYSVNGDVVVSSTMEEEERSPPRNIEEWAQQVIPELILTFWPEILSIAAFVLIFYVPKGFIVAGVIAVLSSFYLQYEENVVTKGLRLAKFLIESPVVQWLWRRVPLNEHFAVTAEPPRVLLFDFGSGESKWMVYSLTEHKMVEILEGEKTRELYPDLFEANMPSDKKWPRWPSQKKKTAPDANHLGDTRDAMMNVLSRYGGQDQLATWVKDIVHAVKPKRVLIGVTSWWRKLSNPTIRANMNNAMAQLEEYFTYSTPPLSVVLKDFFCGEPVNENSYGQRLNFEFLDLSGPNEAEFEALSVRYACKKATDLELNPPRFVIACGNGSIQMVDLHSDAESEYKFCSIDDMGNNNGRQLCAGGADGHERWRRKLERALRTNFPRDGDLVGKVVAISACYYASRVAGITPQTEFTVAEAVDQFQQEHRKLVSQLDEKLAAGENTAARLKTNKKFFTNLSNLTIQICYLKNVFAPDSLVSFHRNWKHPVPGEPGRTTEFRTTWTAGWYIEMLGNHGYILVRESESEGDKEDT